ncbi:MAG: NAD-dependent epimerase/dehydratase family protein, partial [Acidobacteria bacterium]|nr:NAD-dependent epimerase/dehydratase family protein [Acidobacteriota bacterium]
YGFQDARVTEDSPHLGKSSWINYFRTKAMAEDEVRSAVEKGLDAVILNPANIVGPYDAGNWSRLITLIHERHLPGVPSGCGTFAHSREVARAHVAAFEKGRRGESYLLGGVDASYLEMARIVGELTGRKVPQRAAPDLLLRAVGRMNHLRSLVTRKEPDLSPESVALVTRRVICSSEKAEAELGFRPVEVRTMLEDCHRWMVEAGRLS